jgi:hypothetical protein
MLRDYPSIGIGETEALAQIIDTRRDDQSRLRALQALMLRDRTGQRVVPTSNSDVTIDDKVGDYLNDATYKYELVTVSGARKWHRTTLSVGW